MLQKLSYSQFTSVYKDNEQCWSELISLKYPEGIRCRKCKEITPHYRVLKRASYCCKYCRNQIYPLVGTVFEKTSTPLKTWFYAMFLMTHTRSHISIHELQSELGVTYKTAWRMYHRIKSLMKQNNGDLLTKTSMLKIEDKDGPHKVHKWVLFNTIEIKVVQRKSSE